MIKHVTSDVLSSISVSQLSEMVYEIHSAMRKCCRLYVALTGLDCDEMDSDEFIEVCESSLLNDLSAYKAFAESQCSVVPAINRYMLRSLARVAEGQVVKGPIDFYNEKLEEIIKYGAEPVGTERETLKSGVSKLSGLFAYILFYEFGICSLTGEEQLNDLDVAVGQHLERCDEDIAEFVTEVCSTLKQHRPQLSVFDEHPELEDTFFEIVGPYVSDVDEEQLTYEIVTGVINGNIAPTDLYTLFTSEEEE